MDAGEWYLSKSVKFCGALLEHVTLFVSSTPKLFELPFLPIPTFRLHWLIYFFSNEHFLFYIQIKSARELLATIWTRNPFLFLASVVSVVCCWDLCTAGKIPRCRWLMKRQGLSLLALVLEPCRFGLHASSEKNTSILKGVAELQIHDELILDPSSVLPDIGLLCLKKAEVLSVP